MIPERIALTLPAWVLPFLAPRPGRFLTDTDRMSLVIELARKNVEYGTGGPFGAAVLDDATGRLIAAGVNVVVNQYCSAAHAEIVAIMLAQRELNTHDLGAPGAPARVLVTSTEPCAMCLGAVPWSGVRRIVCGARGEDAEAIGMDEGAKPADWIGALAARGIDATRDVCREEARHVLAQYAASGGPIYNGRSASDPPR